MSATLSPVILPPARGQSPFFLALRAFAALLIVWHHFAQYPPLASWAAPWLGEVLGFFERHARGTQVFFVIGGYAAALTMAQRDWRGAAFGSYLLERYCRLGLPYLLTLLLVLPVLVLARGWLPDEVLGAPPTLAQFAAHLLFLQDILGYEALSAGLWFVCINLQFSLLYALALTVRDVGGARWHWLGRLVAWGLALMGLFHFNLDPAWDVWVLFFFPYFFLGILLHHALRGGRRERLAFALYLLVLVLAIGYAWRWRLVIAAVVALALLLAERSGLARNWPQAAWLRCLGEWSFSLFLLHFPVLLLVSTLWAMAGWSSPMAASLGLLVAFAASLGAAALFYRWVELPAAELARRLRRGGGSRWRLAAASPGRG
ncbi:acyltransferase family protein [Dechloromonas sp. ZY10]|uniref:acyltransferase family protein n=1 Tax=Dechloromonas aquae TaxID=2664436 RepID=UPI003528723D